METYFTYLLKVNIAIALLYICYRILFSKDTFLRARRITLISMFAFAFIYPLVIMGWLLSNKPVQDIIMPMMNYNMPVTIIVSDTSPFIGWVEALGIVYFSGVLFFAGQLIIQLISISRLTQKGRHTSVNGHNVVLLDKAVPPFSFFSTIFIHPGLHNEKELGEIMTHENTHVRQRHSIDIIAGKVITVFCWFNPFVWLMNREIRVNLEHLADQQVLQSGYEASAYQFHLLRLSQNQPNPLPVNNFNISEFKRRIIMMNAKKTSGRSLLKYTLLAPVAVLLILSANAQAVIDQVKQDYLTGQNSAETVKGIVVDEHKRPLMGVNILINGTNAGTISEKNGHFSLLAGKSDTLIFSYVGMVPTQVPLSGISGMLTVLLAPQKSGLDEIVVVGYSDHNAPLNQIQAKTTPQTPPANPTGDENLFTNVDVMPEYPGGYEALLKFLAQNVRYPAKAIKNKTEGRVICQFIVDTSGKVTDASILRSLSKETDDEALRVIRLMPDWKPGTHKGKPARILYTLPITFKLDNKPGNKTGSVKSDSNTPSQPTIGEPIRIRGNPLIIVDDVKMKKDFKFDTLNSENIKSVSVMKDSAAYKLYGPEGKDGVLIITTKKK